MDTNATLITDQLLLEPLSENDDDFIIELVNTDGWIKFIGNKNTHSKIDAATYIQKINAYPKMIY